MNKLLKDAVKEIIGEATAAFTIETDKRAIKESADKLSNLLREWNAMDGQVKKSIYSLLSVVRSNCKHEGAQRGYNERDGSWMNPCPTCEHSE